MPRKPKSPCKHPGCPNLTGKRYCDIHTDDRPSAAKRGYDSRWRKARARFLKVHPLCVRCNSEGKLIKATVVDHIIPHRGDELLFWDESNWQALCKRCHDRKTRNKDQYREYKY
ncbi:HNH endonuclease signature motif containing protein [Proteinivorax tanatarense]|uniref:Putative HNH nuclease YajD n=1 Tax=Proteinivorax tanatarense TaxID=1260629 RepID=A0AAU7VK32_9FIRM